MASEKGSRKDKNQNIQVFVRLRPLNQREKDIRSLGVIEVAHGREVIVRQSQSSHTKKFTFDRAFPPQSKQVEVYQEVVSPLIEEVLNGYNCTVFAYGQTGTGKTHTMVGEAASSETTWQNDPQAGIIPRALSQLFDELRLTNTEYTVRVSYLELYNEELFDLLATSEDNSKLRIYEDVTRKGSNIVNGLEEITVYNKNEVYKIMAQGQERKKVASTLMNSQSSRSHTVFTIVVHMKENSPEGEELVKIGKLNLVDLAGSENISKAGSDNPAKRERARECVNINQSLLTLGRVITALVERHPHIPYRESKLTRILQESLGGRTKTSIIATISPGHKDLEETMSTLDYANRAKNIQNKPEVNQKLTKKAILKEYAEEIDRLKRDLMAARDKNGVYLANETYTEMTFKQEEQRKEIQELLLKKRSMEEEKEKMETLFDKQNRQLQRNKDMLHNTYNKLQSTERQLTDTTHVLKSTKAHFEEQRHLVDKQRETESILQEQAHSLLRAARGASCDLTALQDHLDRRRSLESNNLEVTRNYRESSRRHRDTVAATADQQLARVNESLLHIHDQTDIFSHNNTQTLLSNKQKLEEMIQLATDSVNKVVSLRDDIITDIQTESAKNKEQVHSFIKCQEKDVQELLTKFSECQSVCLDKATKYDLTGDLDKFLQYWYSSASSKVSALQQKASGLVVASRQMAQERAAASRHVRQRLDERRDHFAQRVRQRIDDITHDKQSTEARITKQLDRIRQEKADFENRLALYIETERKLLEERQKERIDDIESAKQEFERRVEMNLEWLTNELAESQTELVDVEQRLITNEQDIDNYLVELNKFDTECKTETTYISRDLSELGDAALKVVDNVKVELVSELQQTQRYIHEQTQLALSSNSEAMVKLCGQTDSTIDCVVQHTGRSLGPLVDNIQTHTNIVNTDLQQLSSCNNDLVCLSELHKNKQDEALMNLQGEMKSYTEAVKAEVRVMGELEDKCLNEEYAVYSPTGGTPARKEYRYPESLAATSPHDRILARYRANLQRDIDDCILIEGGNESRGSDTDSTASEDSAVAASPPTHLTPTPTLELPGIVKCTSDTDITYSRQLVRDRSKENVNRSMCNAKKPSKLPAFSSHKKPLLDRNVDN